MFSSFFTRITHPFRTHPHWMAISYILISTTGFSAMSAGVRLRRCATQDQYAARYKESARSNKLGIPVSNLKISRPDNGCVRQSGNAFASGASSDKG